jgi:acyl-coenzyme A synthetase/AMP-(fatty) acid ligase
MYYRWDPTHSVAQAENGIVPIGYPFPSMTARVVDEGLRPVAPGVDGELVMSGAQLTLGYLGDPDRTAAAFVRLPNEDETFYRTGDRVRRPFGENPMVYLGRVDHQVKILGYRVELGEIEAAVRDASGIDGVVAVAWPQAVGGGAAGVEVFVQAETIDSKSLQERLTATLPSYMVPRRIHALTTFPLNANGKFDRLALTDMLRTQG